VSLLMTRFHLQP
jgi:hypothetical protein